jgi:hypothetical protein
MGKEIRPANDGRIMGMQRGFRRILTVFAVVIALMSGILSLVREFLLFEYPTKFQEPPLFWACLRIAFGVSLIALWYEERQKRLSLEKDLQPEPSFKEEVLKLSASILEFAYERSQNAPIISVRPLDLENPRYLRDDMAKSHAEMEAIKSYESDTLGLYDTRFRRRVAATVSSLKKKGFSDSELEGLVDTSSWLHPYGASIKEVWRRLGEVADKASES